MISQRLLRSILPVLLLIPMSLGAVGLGEARVHSYMLQPLSAEIELFIDDLASPQDIRLRLASRKVLDRLGVPYDRLFPQLRFQVVKNDAGKWVALLTTRDPVREPFFSFAVQASWPEGNAVREYSLLLDPPQLQRIVERQATPAAEPQTVPSAPQPATVADSGGTYGPVRPGETLWPIAQKLKPSGVTTHQMMMALLKANPHAFRNNNINNLQVGVTLRVPSAAEINNDYSRNEARNAVAGQMAEWRGPAAAPATTATTPPAEEPAAEAAPPGPAAADNEQLRIVSRSDDVQDEPLRKELMLTLEQVEADRMRSEQLSTRVEKLESEMDYLQRLLVLKEKQIATLQQIAVTQDAVGKIKSGEVADAKQAEPPAQPAPQAEVRPVEPRAVAPALPASDSKDEFERQLLIYAIVALILIIATLGFILVRRGKESRASDYTLAGHPELKAPEDRPYADQVTRYSSKPEPASESDKSGIVATSGFGKAPTPPSVSAPVTAPEAPPVTTAEDMVSDDDLAAWARDLDEELEVPEPGDLGEEALATNRLPSGEGYSGGDIDVDIPSLILDIDEELKGEEEGAEDSSILDLAQAYMEIGDLDGARELLEKLVEDSGDSPEATRAKSLLAEIDAGT